MAAMTGSILGAAEVPEELRALIAGKAEGNPFFVEELAARCSRTARCGARTARVVLAADLGDIAVPDTMQDVLIARIDRLAEESRRAIQVASVIGREFALRLLARITEAGDRIRVQVEELRSLELIYEKALHPELAYMFKHALTHDVAYESVLRERRKALHRTIGRAIEELYADRLAEHYETLAHHFSRGEDWERALGYYDRSAREGGRDARQPRRRRSLPARPGDRRSARRSRLGPRCAAASAERLGHACFYLSDFAASAAAYEERRRSARIRNRPRCS